MQDIIYTDKLQTNMIVNNGTILNNTHILWVIKKEVVGIHSFAISERRQPIRLLCFWKIPKFIREVQIKQNHSVWCIP